MKWSAFLELPKSWRRWIVRLALAFVVYSLIGFFLAPLIIKSQLVKRLPSLTQRQAEVRQVRVNPWTLSLTIRGLTLAEPDRRVFASWEEFYANFQLSSLFRWAWTFKEIRLSEPFGEVILQPDGRFNFGNMFKSTNAPPSAPQKSKGAMMRTQIFLLNITHGVVVFEDRTRRSPFRTEYKPINVRLTDLTTRPGTASPYSFNAENDTGKTLAWAGDITVEPFGSRGVIQIQRATPKKYQPYLDDFTRAQIVDGRVNIRADYAFSTDTNGVDLIVSNGVVQLTGLKVVDPEANESVLSVPAFSIEQGQLNLRERTARAGLVKFTAPELMARLNRDGSLNLLSLLTSSTTNRTSLTNSPPVPQPWTLAAAGLRIENATLAFEDRSRKTVFQTKLKPVDVTIKQFTTRADADASYTFFINTEAAETVSGSGTLSINPVRSTGEIKLAAGEVKKYWPYFEQTLRGEILAGKLDVLANYRAALATLDVVISNGVVRLSGLQLKSPDTGETVVSVPEFAVERADANLKEHTARAGLVKTTGGSILTRRNSDGSFNLLTLLQPSTDAPSATNSVTTSTNQPANAASRWTVFLDELAVENYAVKCEDKVPSKPALLNLDQIALDVKGLSTVSNTPINATLSMRINDRGLVTLSGTALLAPQTADLELGVTNLDLRALQPYLEPHLKLSLAGGALAMHGRVLWQPAETNAPRLQFKGGLSVTSLLTTDQAAFEEFVKWNTLDVDGIDFTMQPERLHIDAVRWDGLTASLLIGPDKQPNLSAIFPRPTHAPPVEAPNAPAATASTKSPVPFPVSLNTLALSNSAFRFSDASVEPNCHFAIQQLGGTIQGLSSDPSGTADVDLTGRVDEQSPFSIVGKVNPLAKDRMLGLSFSNRNLQLTPFTPYMEKFAGYPLNKGRLTLNLHYEIQGNQLKAQNQFEIDQLVLGTHNNSPDATKLPVKLAVALLKDRNGRIDLDLPVTGRLDDPQFRIGPIILKVIVNLIAKAATSPFKLLGALVGGGGGDELSYVQFVPGEALLREGETNKIEKLTKALFERPAVNLEIEASVDPRLDRDALARQMVKASMRTLRLQELAAVGQTPPVAEGFQMEAAEYERLLRAAVVKQFGTNLSDTLRALAETLSGTNDVTGGSASTNRSRAKVASRPAEKHGLLPRLAGWILPPKKSSLAGAARQQAKADLALLKQNPELGSLTAEIMEALLASKTEVPPDSFLQLMQNRTQAVQKELLQNGQLTPERLFLIAPKPVKATSPGEARANLSLN